MSGASFATTVLLGRLAGPAELGLYSLAITLALLTTAVQESLVTQPYTVFCHRMHEADRRVYAGSAVALHAALAFVAIATGAMGVALSAAGLLPGGLMAPLVLWSMIVAPFLLRELARRVLYASLRIDRVLFFDAGVSCLQLLLLGVVAWRGRLSALIAGLTLAAACAVGGIGWLIAVRRDVCVTPQGIGAALGRNWKFGRWVLAGRLLSTLNSETLLLWMTALLLNREATGVLAACRTIALLSNPFVLGLGNLITPRIARAYGVEGREGLRRAATQTTWSLCVPLAGFCLVVWFFGSTALRVLYGTAYVGQHGTVTVLALCVLCSSFGTGAANGLLTLLRQQLNVVSAMVGLAVTLLGIWVLAGRYGVFGAALGLLAGLATESLATIVLFAHSLTALEYGPAAKLDATAQP